MKPRFLILLILVLAGMLFITNLFRSESSEKISTAETVSIVAKNERKTEAKPVAVLIKNTESMDRAFWSDSLLENPLFAELNDVLLHVRNPLDLNDSLDNFEKGGFEVIDRIDELGTFRVKIYEPAKFTEFLGENENEFGVYKNVTLKSPTYPDSRMLEVEEPFMGSSMDWLGVRPHRKDAGKGVKVAIIDTGVDTSHDSLSGIKITEISLLNDDDSHWNLGHGTGIASVIAGQTEDFVGIAPSTEILSVRVLNESGEGDSFTVAKGIVEAVDQGADIINLSLGGMDSSIVMDNAIEYAKLNNVLMVSAVGNEGVQGVSFPARHRDVVAVTSVDAKSRVSTFSNYGDEVDIAAPGVGVVTAWEENEFVHFSGTSIATAFVTGALASELSYSSLEDKEEALNALYANADEAEKPGKDIWAGRGVLNVRRLEQRNTPGIVDAAVVGYYFDTEKITSSGTTPFFVTIQNQGTSWLQSTNLKVNYKGLEKNFKIGSLNAGESRSEMLYYDAGIPEKKLHITSELSISGQTDQYPENNTRQSFLILP
ncbi:MAG: S8 family serine peptidase [Verrucomicrobiota bacterium]|nr:S8 family serine peptidase [Verrucomicrobiota bacterium]